MYYFEKAYRLKPEDRLILHGLAFGYEKLGDINNARKFYQKLLENNPTNTDYYNYGAFLISCGELQEGHKFLTHRFNIDDKNLQYPVSTSKGVKWDLKSDISDKTLLVHYEQGFGDTFMYCRFVPGLKPLAKKVIFVVQNELFELIKSSEIFEGIDIVSSKLNLDELEFDVHMSPLDAPFVCGVDSCNLPYTDKYLNVDEILVQEYAKKYLVSSGCLKVGISYQGNKSANYNGRDIDFSRFSRLFNLKNIDFYFAFAFRHCIMHYRFSDIVFKQNIAYQNRIHMVFIQYLIKYIFHKKRLPFAILFYCLSCKFLMAIPPSLPKQLACQVFSP